MNLQCLLRKRELGIENFNDYIYWADSLLIAGDRRKILRYLNNQEIGYDDDFVKYPELEKNIKDAFDLVVAELNLSIPEVIVDQSIEAHCVRDIYQECVKHDKDIYSIDLSVILETDRSKDVLTLVGEMACRCGAYPLGDRWNEHDKAVGKKALKEVFIYECDGGSIKAMPDNDADKLANMFYSKFSNKVRFFTNITQGLVVVSGGLNYLQNRRIPDFGLVLVDDERIGMIMIVGHN